MIKLNLVVEKNCPVCARVRSNLELIASGNHELELIIYDIEKHNEFHAQIVPSLFIEDKLFAIGEFDIERLKSAIS